MSRGGKREGAGTNKKPESEKVHPQCITIHKKTKEELLKCEGATYNDKISILLDRDKKSCINCEYCVDQRVKILECNKYQTHVPCRWMRNSETPIIVGFHGREVESCGINAKFFEKRSSFSNFY